MNLADAFAEACTDIETTLGRELTSQERFATAMAFSHGAKYGIRETSANAQKAQRAVYGANIGDIA